MFKPTWLQIQRQLGTGKRLNDTTAGQMVDQDLAGKIQKYHESFDSTLAEIQQSHNHELQAALREQADEYTKVLDKAKAERKKLKADLKKRVEADEERRMKLAEEQRSSWQVALSYAPDAVGVVSFVSLVGYKIWRAPPGGAKSE